MAFKIKHDYDALSVAPRKNLGTGNGGGNNMDLERRVGNLEDNVNQLRIDVTEIKTALKSTAQQNDMAVLRGELTALRTEFHTVIPTLAKNEDLVALRGELTALRTEFHAVLPTLAKNEDLNALKTEFHTVLPTLAKNEDLIALRTEFKTTLPHLVTKTWLAGAMIVLLLAQILIPIVKDNLHFNFDKPVITQVK